MADTDAPPSTVADATQQQEKPVDVPAEADTEPKVNATAAAPVSAEDPAPRKGLRASISALLAPAPKSAAGAAKEGEAEELTATEPTAAEPTLEDPSASWTSSNLATASCASSKPTTCCF